MPINIENLYRQSLSLFAQRAFSVINPSYEYQHNWHIDCIAAHLESVRRGKIEKLAITIPPRMLKTFITGVCLPAWIWATDPTQRFIYTSFSDSLCNDTAVALKTLIQSDWYKSIALDFELSNAQAEKKDFWTTRNGRFYAATILGTITGKGTDWLIIDDPLKPSDGRSDTVRLRTNNVISETLFTRFNNPNEQKTVMIMQRLHPNDPVGHFCDDNWTKLDLPAEAITQDYLYSVEGKEWSLQAGELLFPERFGADVLEQKRRELGSENYAAQFLQQPFIAGAGEFKSDWFQYYSSNSFNASACNIAIIVDPAGDPYDTKGRKRKKTDYTAIAIIGLAPDRNRYLIEGIRERMNPSERIEKVIELFQKWFGKTGKKPKVYYEEYGMQSDIFFLKQRQDEMNYRFPVEPLGGRMSKNDRIRRLIPDIEAGNWYFPNDLFVKDEQGAPELFIQQIMREEFLLFPNACVHDDFMDALARIYDTGLTYPMKNAFNVKDETDFMIQSEKDIWDF